MSLIQNIPYSIHLLFWGMFFSQFFASLLFIVWRIFRKKLENAGNVKLIYIFLKLEAVLFLVPFSFIIDYERYSQTLCIDNHFLLFTDKILYVERILLAIGLTVSILFAFRAFRQRQQFKRMKKFASPADFRCKERLEQLCEMMQFRDSVQVFELDGITSPFTVGSFEHKIYIPVKDYDDDVLDIVLRHELVHCQHKDILTKKLIALARILFWYNPMTKLLWKDYEKYSESYCDYTVCEQLGKCSKYFNTIIQIVAGKTIYPVSAMLKENDGRLKERVVLMKKWKTATKTKKRLAVFAAACIFLFSSITASAAENTLANAYFDLWTMTSTELEVTPLPDYEEFEGNIYEEGTEIIEDKSMQIKRGTSFITWKIQPNQSLETPKFYLNAGQQIFVSVSVEPRDKRVRVGLVDDAGTTKYISSKGNISKEFYVSKSGYYRVYVSNIADSTVDVNGYFNY